MGKKRNRWVWVKYGGPAALQKATKGVPLNGVVTHIKVPLGIETENKQTKTSVSQEVPQSIRTSEDCTKLFFQMGGTHK